MSQGKPISTTVVSLLLAAAQLLVVTHTAFVTHSISVSGEHHHVLTAADQSHAHHAGPTATWCSEHVELKPVDDLACTAAKCATLMVSAAEEATPDPDQAWPRHPAPAFRFTRNPLSVLSCSPKASPPSPRLS